MDSVYLVWKEDNTSWQHTGRTLLAVYASRNDAKELIPDWAKERQLSEYDTRRNVVWASGADGIEFVCIETEVK